MRRVGRGLGRGGHWNELVVRPVRRLNDRPGLSGWHVTLDDPGARSKLIPGCSLPLRGSERGSARAEQAVGDEQHSHGDHAENGGEESSHVCPLSEGHANGFMSHYNGLAGRGVL